MFLYHYYDKKIGSFKNLSELTADRANDAINEIKINKPNVKCAQRDPEYMFSRRMYEDIIKKEFIKKGGMSREMHHAIWWLSIAHG